MAFPQSPVAVAYELQLGGTWTDITSKVYTRAPVKIKRGRSSEAANVEPSQCDLTLDNRDGRFSPRNPTGAYYGLIGRNTPLRVRVDGLDVNSLQSPGTASTPSVAALNTTADLDVRVELVPYSWTRSANLIGKWNFASQCSWMLTTGTDGRVTLFWSTTGSDFPAATSTVAPPRDSGRRFAVRAQLIVATGVVSFWYADAIAGPWLQLGTPVATGLVGTSVFASTTAVAFAPGTGAQGRFYKAEIRTGAGAATLAASPDFTAQATGAGSFVDAQARTWTVAGSGITSTNVRFVGEVSSWPVRWDQSGHDVYAPVVAAGILRRLQANTPPLLSVLRRSLPTLPQLRAYWPSEDLSGASALSSPTPNVAPATIANGPSLSSYSGFAASDPIPVWANASYARGKVPSYTSTGKVQLRFLLNVPTSGQPTDGTNLALLETTGTRWRFIYKLPNSLQVQCTDLTTGVVAYTSGVVGFALDGKTVRASLELTQNGANVDWAIATLVPGATSGSVTGGTAPAVTLGRATAVTWGTPGSSSSQTAIGHVTVESDVTSLFVLGDQLNAYVGETASARALRLATEEGYTLQVQGTSTTAMGPQRSESLIELLRECADADLAILSESRGTSGLSFRTRASMYDRGPANVLGYTSGQITDLQPVEDDQQLVNDVVLTRLLGSTYEAALTTGALSTAAPPNGVGRYTDARTLVVATDSQLRDQATYRLALGTVDSPRYPTVQVLLEKVPTLPALRSCLDLDLGDVLEVDNPPSFYAPSTILQRVEGTTEVLAEGGYSYELAWSCSPGELWANVGRYDDPGIPSRYDAAAATLAAGVTAVATTLSVASGDGILWTTNAAHWPFQVLVAGEVMTVTAVTGASSPQSFTVTRAVNGVSKAQLSGAAVHVYPVSYYAL